MAKGECNCGTVRFEITSGIRDVYMCHCSICRRMTGGAGVPVVVVPNEDFRWLSGQDNIATWKKPDVDWQGWFCRTCGSPLPGDNDPTRTYVPVGVLTEGTEALEVKHHIWVGSKAHWDVIGDAGTQHPEAFGTG